MYSEQIYSSFAHELLMGTGPVSVGQALVRAKQDYLRVTPSLQGIDQKALLEATLFGLPMLSVDLPNGRIPTPSDITTVNATAVGSGPGFTLGLKSASIDVTGTLTQVTKTLEGSGTGQVGSTYYTGPDGISSKPYEPTLPLISRNVNVPGMALRGIGFFGGAYQESSVVPLSGAPATEFGIAHTPFSSPTFYPEHLAAPNYFDALGGGDTRLMVTPAQHKSNGTADFTSTLRLYSDVNLKLFYSSNFATSGGLSPALAAAPGIYDVSASENTPGTIAVRAHVVGDPSAGIQETWVTWTGFDHAWHSADLVQDSTDSTLWTGTIAVPSGHQAADVQFMLQSVNGVGLVGLNDNYAHYFSVIAPAAATLTTTHLALDAAPTDGVFLATVAFTATLTSGADPIAGQSIRFTLGGVTTIGDDGQQWRRVGQLRSNADAGDVLVDCGLPGQRDLCRLVEFEAVHDPDAQAELHPKPDRVSAAETSGSLRSASPIMYQASTISRCRHLRSRQRQSRLLSDARWLRHDHWGHCGTAPVRRHRLDRRNRKIRRRRPGLRFLLHRQSRPERRIHLDGPDRRHIRRHVRAYGDERRIRQPGHLRRQRLLTLDHFLSHQLYRDPPTGGLELPRCASGGFSIPGLVDPAGLPGRPPNRAALTPCSVTVIECRTATPTVLNNIPIGTTRRGQLLSPSPSSGSATFSIGKAASTTTVTCPVAPVTYTGSALVPCWVTVTGAGLNLAASPIYTNNIAAGTNSAGASYSYPGDPNHLPSNGSATFSIAKAEPGPSRSPPSHRAPASRVGTYVPAATGGGSGDPVTFA